MLTQKTNLNIKSIIKGCILLVIGSLIAYYSSFIVETLFKYFDTNSTQTISNSNLIELSQPNPSLEDSSSENEEILDLINYYRINGAKLKGLELDPCLNKIAERRLEEVKIDYNHDQAQMPGWLDKCNMVAVTENLASYANPNQVVSDWLNSYDHKKNIEGYFDKVGIAASDSDALAVTVFGKSSDSK